MDYDFSSLCADQIEKLDKRLKSLNKACLKEYKVALNVINNPKENEHRGETVASVEDLLNDVANKCQIFYTENMNKIQRELAKHL